MLSVFVQGNDNREPARHGRGFPITDMSATYRFPPGFLWGAATSSHQVEGNNRCNDWWEFEQAGRLPYASGNACEHFERYESDFDLARSWGHNAHRLSIEWRAALIHARIRARSDG
jgi:Glycosyl hydrolase family 1